MFGATTWLTLDAGPSSTHTHTHRGNTSHAAILPQPHITACLQADDAGCLAGYVNAVCSNSAGQPFQTGLFNAAKRCANIDTSCQKANGNGAATAAAVPTALLMVLGGAGALLL